MSRRSLWRNEEHWNSPWKWEDLASSILKQLDSTSEEIIKILKTFIGMPFLWSFYPNCKVTSYGKNSHFLPAITEEEKNKWVLHQLPLNYLKVTTTKETNKGLGISLCSELLWLWFNKNSLKQATMLAPSQGIDWYIYLEICPKNFNNIETSNIPVLLHHFFCILTASCDNGMITWCLIWR